MLKKRLLGLITAFALGMGVLCAVPAQTVFADEQDTIDIVFMHDWHSYLASYKATKDGETVEIGGAPRISTFIKEKRVNNPDTIVVDAGDYPMGTLYQSMFTEEAFEYRMLSKLGFDATTFGNHDFDYGADGLAAQFEVAKANCDYYPAFAVCNINWNADNEYTKTVYNSLKDMNLCDYTILEKGGKRIGITGVLGIDAVQCAPTCELEIMDQIESVKATVEKMKKEENPDIIICLSHGGTDEDKDKSEDEILAKEVPDIDFIVSGHSHTVIPEAIKIGDTYVGSCGCYGEYMGYVQLKKNESGRYDLVTYEIVPMDSSVAEDPEILELLDEYDNKISEEFLSAYGYTADSVVCENPYEFDSIDDHYFIHEDHDLGNLIADAYRWAVDNTDTGDDEPVAVSVAPAGTIRATYPKGKIDIAKVYESYSLGSGPDGTVGFPLVSIYLTGEELMTMCEIDATISELMNSANLYLSGLEFEFNPNRAFLNKVTDAWLNTQLRGQQREEIDPEKLYRVVTDMYSYNMLGAVKSTSKGLLSVATKDKNGNPITDVADAVIHDKDGNEVKAWISIAQYMESFEENKEGIGIMPEYYEQTGGDRKVIVDSKNPIDNVQNPNRFFFGFFAVILVVALVIGFTIFPMVLVIKNIGKKHQKTEGEEIAEKLEELSEFRNGESPEE